MCTKKRCITLFSSSSYKHYAGRAGHLSVCKLLVDCGACVNAQTRGGATPLHRSAYCGHLSVVELLLDRGADPHLTDDDGTTPLHKVLINFSFYSL